MSRSVQDLLAERRANVLEMSHSDDRVEKEMLRAHIDYLDQLIAEIDEEDDDYAWEREPRSSLVDDELEGP